MKMKIFVTTCNYTSHLLRGFSYLFNKFWGDSHEVIVLYYDAVPKLPDNFTCVSVGRMREHKNYWTNALIPIFKSLRDDYFILFLDDFWLKKRVKIKILNSYSRYIKMKAVRIAISNEVLNRKHIITPYGIETAQDATYRASLQASIWSREYFLRLLKPNRTIWDFEKLGSKERLNDGFLQITNTPFPCDYRHVWRWGTWFEPSLKDYNMNLLEELKQKGCL